MRRILEDETQTTCLNNIHPAIIVVTAVTTETYPWIAALAPLSTLPKLVLPIFSRSFPDMPLDVSSTAGSTVAVFMSFVKAVVENVISLSSTSGLPLMKTRAKPGAGTRIWQVLDAWSQGTVTTSRSPLR